MHYAVPIVPSHLQGTRKGEERRPDLAVVTRGRDGLESHHRRENWLFGKDACVVALFVLQKAKGAEGPMHGLVELIAHHLNGIIRDALWLRRDAEGEGAVAVRARNDCIDARRVSEANRCAQ